MGISRRHHLPSCLRPCKIQETAERWRNEMVASFFGKTGQVAIMPFLNTRRVTADSYKHHCLVQAFWTGVQPMLTATSTIVWFKPS